ncbi:glycosyltransferase family 4 protein [Acidisoma sp.]|uniref:glycosyltransferase family 4 protein n=1 Tax=Acidisoma sp. TaxID=1872115 RepID=UPI002D7E510A|nr:glycosyltransferase family 4 protein [Acidisoma sp.]
MRVVHIVRQFHPSVGGLEDTVLSLARAQRDRLGLDARVVTLDRVFGSQARLPHAELVHGVPVRRLAWAGSQRYPLAPSVLRNLQHADLLHVHAIDFFFDFLALTRLVHRRPMIATTHGGFFHTSRFRAAKKIWMQTITRASIRGYQRIVACSHSDAEMFQPLASERLMLIENGITQEKFGAASSVTPTKTILSFGRFARHKRTDQILRVFQALRAIDSEWRLIIAGRDADQTAVQLGDLAQQLGISDGVEIVQNPSDEMLRALMGRASFYGSLSAYEGFGLAAVEGMSAGLIPILSDIPAFVRLVTSGGVGLNVDAENPAAVAQSIVDFFARHREFYDSYRGRAMAVALRYDWREVAAQYASLYNTATGRETALQPVVRSGIAD